MFSYLFPLFTLLILLLPLTNYAQQFQGWGIYFGNTAIKDSKFSIHHELQLRDYKIIGDHQQTLLRLGLQYQANASVNFTLGYGYIYNELAGSPNDPFSENRIYQEALIKHSWTVFQFRHRFRTEERFDPSGFRGRGRYCVFVDMPLTDKKMKKGGTYLALYDEVFVNAFAREASLFDRNRLYGGVGFKLQDNFGIQLGYMRQHVGALAGTNHVLLSFHQQLKIK